MNPLEHFVRYGADEGRSPHFLMDFKAYLSLHPEVGTYRSAVKQLAQSALMKFHNSPRQEDNALSRLVQNLALEVHDTPRLSMSVVIPTHNRADMLDGTLRRCLQVSRHLPLDFMIVSDGCTDNTIDRLHWYSRHFDNVRFVAIEKSGAATARNAGAARAQGDLIMFTGDDIRPVDSEFFAAHMRTHEKLSEPETIIEGHVDWPKQSGFQVNAVMRLIQGSGAQQFGYHYMQPHTFFDWRHFWSANISIKRNLVMDWSRDGFSPAFRAAAYEDTEFAYRINKSRPNLRIYYAAESVGEHFHNYGLTSFIRRQINAGEMARTLVDMHPELASFIDVEELDGALRSGRPDPMDMQLLLEFECIVQGLKSWGVILEAHQDLGTQGWHDDYLNALFQLCHGEGYLNTFRGNGGNIAEGYRVLLRRFQQRLVGSRSPVPILRAIALS
jgi:glycosyltransferase involved in cell wall biosynthesis